MCWLATNLKNVVLFSAPSRVRLFFPGSDGGCLVHLPGRSNFLEGHFICLAAAQGLVIGSRACLLYAYTSNTSDI